MRKAPFQLLAALPQQLLSAFAPNPPPVVLPPYPPSAAARAPVPSSTCAPATPLTPPALRCCDTPYPVPLLPVLPDSRLRSSPRPLPLRSVRRLPLPSSPPSACRPRRPPPDSPPPPRRSGNPRHVPPCGPGA